jgi:NAD(P)-dependent dehydrogenase (short-subunit alcohol dehydrogenase family)
MSHASSTADLRASTLFSYSSHIALITGGATGLGECAAQALIQNGARVLIASRKESELRATTTRLNALGPGRAEYIVANLSSRAGCDALVAEVKKRVDRLTLLLNNAGMSWGDKYEDFAEDGWDRLMALNVKSAFYMTAGLDGLLRAGATAEAPGRVLNVASVAGVSTRDVTVGAEGGLARPGTGTFSCEFFLCPLFSFVVVVCALSRDRSFTNAHADGPSKAALIHLTKVTASKLAPLHVTVNAICPGVFPSRMTSYGLDTHAEELVRGQPTGRIGTPEDFAGLVLFLASRGAAHITGVAIEIDGGSNISGWRGKGPERDSKM